MPQIPIKFSKGISRLSGSSLESVYDLKNCRITPFDEIVTWRRGTSSDDRWIPRVKPWLKIGGRWFDGESMDAFVRYRNRGYMTRVVDPDDEINAKTETLQYIDEVSDPDTFIQYRGLNFLPTLLSVGGTDLIVPKYTGDETGATFHQSGSLSGLKGWAADDTGIQGITNGRAVDYIFVPIDRFGQAGPWSFSTVVNDQDPSSFENVSGTDVKTATVNFAFPELEDIFSDEEIRYEKVLIYRTIEYDLEGLGTASEVILGGYYLEGITGDSSYTSSAYWPFNITKADSGLADQLGPVIDRSRNHWKNTFVGNFSNNLGAKTAHIDAGVALYGNVSFPTKFAIPAHFQTRATATVTATFATGPNTITRGSGSWVTDGFAVGDNVWIQGAVNATNNKKLTISAVTTSVITVEETLTAEAATAGVYVFNAPRAIFRYRYTKEDGSVVFNAVGSDAPYGAKRAVIPFNSSESGVDVYVEMTGAVTDIDSSANTISIQGDWSRFFGANVNGERDKIVISGTSSNNETFTLEDTASIALVVPSTGGTLTFNASAGTITRSLGSWITDGYTTGQVIAVAGLINNWGYYTITGTVTTSTITVVESVVDEVVYNYSITAESVGFSGGVTTITVEETISVDESSGTFTFYMLWESIGLDSNGRYRSAKQDPRQHYTFNARTTQDFFDSQDYANSQAFATIPDGVWSVREKSFVYMSEQNAPWEITLDGFAIPDSSEIVAIAPSRIEEVEQLTAYSFYVFTTNGIYVGLRENREVSLTSINAVIGLQTGNSGQPLVEPVKGGVVFFGTDDALYFLTGRSLQKLSYPVQELFTTVNDMGYDPTEDFLYVFSGSGVYIYDFNRSMWMGNYSEFQPIVDYKCQFVFDTEVDGTEIANDQIGDDIVVPDDYTFDQTDFRFYGEEVPSIGLRLNLLVDRVSPPGTDVIAVIQQPSTVQTIGDAWTVISGDITSGDVVINNGDTVYLTVNTVGSFSLPGRFNVQIKGITGAGDINQGVESIGFDPDTLRPLFSYKAASNEPVYVVEDMDQSGEILFDPEITTQELDGEIGDQIEMIAIDYDGPQYSSTTNITADSAAISNLGTGDAHNGGRDEGAVVKIDDAGLATDGSTVDLVTFIASLSPPAATLATPSRATASSRTYTWWPLAALTIYMLGDAYGRGRTNSLSRRIKPNQILYPKNVKTDHRVRFKVEDFETLRLLRIFTDNNK